MVEDVDTLLDYTSTRDSLFALTKAVVVACLFPDLAGVRLAAALGGAGTVTDAGSGTVSVQVGWRVPCRVCLVYVCVCRVCVCLCACAVCVRVVSGVWFRISPRV